MNSMFRRALSNPQLYWGMILLGVACALASRFYYIDYYSHDMRRFLERWVRFIHKHGLEAYGHRFSDYAPLYTYLLGLGKFIFSSLETKYMVKLLSFVGEGVAAWFTYRILRTHYTSWRVPLLGAVSLLLLPSVVINSAATGQCDIWYTAFLMGSLYAIISRDPQKAWVYFGVAFAFKLQAVFLLPFLFLCLLRGDLSWRLLWVPAAVYLLTCLPAWLEGRSLLSLLKVYVMQFGVWRYGAPGNAGNFYFLTKGLPYVWVVGVGSAMAALLAFEWGMLTARKGKQELSSYDFTLLATLSLATMPFILPKILERYFFPAEAFALILAFMRPQLVVVVLLLQLSSLINPFVKNFAPFAKWIGLSGYERRVSAAFINLGAISVLWFAYYQAMIRPVIVREKGST